MMSFSIEVDKEAYENYFRIADSNGDGKINGSEAVAFFHGSNLPQELLSQVPLCPSLSLSLPLPLHSCYSFFSVDFKIQEFKLDPVSCKILIDSGLLLRPCIIY